MQEEKVAFSNEYVETANVQKGVKLKNKTIPQTKPDPEEFEKQANDFVSKKQQRNKEAINLVKQFFSILQDRTLPQNKSSIALDIEQENLSKLINMAMEIDFDETEEQEAMGTYALLNTLLKAFLKQRDVINVMSYKTQQLERQLSSMKQHGANE